MIERTQVWCASTHSRLSSELNTAQPFESGIEPLFLSEYPPNERLSNAGIAIEDNYAYRCRDKSRASSRTV